MKITNLSIIPRDGRRSKDLGLKKSLCCGAEWPRIKNLVFMGKLDLGDLNG